MLEESGIIDHYTVVIDHEKVGSSVEAYVELTFKGGADVQTILGEAMDEYSEIREASTLAGDLDAMVRLRVKDPDDLRDTVMRLRQLKSVTGSKTLFALGRMRQASHGGSLRRTVAKARLLNPWPRCCR